MPGIPLIDGLNALSGQYDAIICDVWGVLHNGIRATPGASEALIAARRNGMPVVLLTNAPRPPEPIQEQLRGFGVRDDAYDAIISSGGVSRALIEAEGDRPFYHLGPSRDAAIYRGLAARPVPQAQASYILCTGLFDDETETAEDYRPSLEEARAQGLKLYCANPDLVVERGSTILPCAGAIALLYEQMGGEAVYIGKPYDLVYRHARAALAQIAGHTIPARRILCIGDALRTDVAGALRAGHEVLMLLSGIHAHEIGLSGSNFDAAVLEALCVENKARPTMAMVSLAW